MGKVSIFLQGGIVFLIISGCSSYRQVTCRSLFNEGDLAGSRLCCEEIYDEKLKAFCLTQLDLAEEVRACLRRAFEKQKAGELFKAYGLYGKAVATSHEMSWDSEGIGQLKVEIGRLMDSLFKEMLAQVERLYQSHHYREVGRKVEICESVLGNGDSELLTGFKEKAGAQIAFIEERLGVVRTKLKKGDYAAAGKILRKVKGVAPEYGEEVRELESRIRKQRKRALGRRYERYKQSYAAGMRRKDYHNAVRAVEKAMKIARGNARFGADLPDLESMHKKAAMYRAYALIVQRYDDLMQGDKGKYPLRVYRTALFEAKNALELVQDHPVLAAEKKAATERVRLVREKIEQSAGADQKGHVVAEQL